MERYELDECISGLCPDGDHENENRVCLTPLWLPTASPKLIPSSFSLPLLTLLKVKKMTWNRQLLPGHKVLQICLLCDGLPH